MIETKKFVGDEATANNHCFKRLCSNLKTRHRLSKEAVKQLDAIVKLQEARRFERISYSTIPDEEEAWSLFKKMGGDYVDGSEFKCVARQVVKEYAGLPVSIVTIARVLRTERLFEWKDALEKPGRPSPMNFKDIQPTA